MTTTEATFDIEMTPGTDLDGAVGRFDFTKTWSGGIEGTSRGFMASAGDPDSGEAGYVAIEVVTGNVDGRAGTFTMAQFGSMTGGGQTLLYEVVPNSGTGELTGISGAVDLSIDDAGTHTVRFDYHIPVPHPA